VGLNRIWQIISKVSDIDHRIIAEVGENFLDDSVTLAMICRLASLSEWQQRNKSSANAVRVHRGRLDAPRQAAAHAQQD
jgi:hypothetical protein